MIITIKRAFFSFSTVVTLCLANAAFAEKVDVLVFSANIEPWAHTESIANGVELIEELGEQRNWNVDTTVNSSAFTAQNLAQYDVVVFNNTGGNLFNAAQKASFQQYIRAGGGYVGIHSASATEFGWEWYGNLVGAVNDGHPVPQNGTINVQSSSHPACLHLNNSFNVPGEWYNWKSGTDPRDKEGMNILLSVDGDTITNLRTGGIDDRSHPVAWYREFDGGRSFYTVQGHYPSTLEEEYFETFLAEGIKWAADAVEQNGLLLDLDANQNIEIQNGNKVSKWTNKAPTNIAQDFVARDEGREVANVPINSRGVDLLGIGSGRPTLITGVSELNGNNSLSFQEDELVNLEENAFDHLSHGNGYTWLSVMSRYQQRWPDQKIQEVNAFFGNLRNGNPYDGLWAGFNSNNALWASTRTASASGRDLPGDDWIIGPVLPEREYFIAAGRLGEGRGTVAMEMFVNSADAYDSVPVLINPNGNPSKFALGTERDAVNHPGRESFDGEIARFLVYERPLSDLELQQTMASLQLKYLSKGGQSATGDELLFDFESGDLQGASVTQGQFGDLVTNKARFNTTGQIYNKEGTFFLSTLEGDRHDAYTGTITSPEFLLTGPSASLLIGGGSSADLSFSVHLADGLEIYSTNRGQNREPLERREFDLGAYVGETVYWQVSDYSTSSWGYIAVDSIRFEGVYPGTSNNTGSNDFESADIANLTVTGSLPGLLQNRDSYLVPRNYTSPNINKQGSYFLSTIDNGVGGFSDRFTGTVTSKSFVLTSDSASVLVGGGSNASLVYFGMYTENGTEITRAANSKNSETFERVSLDLSAYVGETVYWKMVDNSTGGWGWISVDDIRFD